MIEIENLAAGYGGASVLRDVSIHVAAGEIVAVLGANGVGKTTLNQTLSGLVRASAGRITFAGERIDGLSAPEIVARGLVHVPEGRKIFPDLSVRENLDLGAYRRGKAHRTRNIERIFAIFPRLKERERQSAGTLSGGEQQMLAIGRALLARPRLLLLDEPSLGIAPILVQQIFKAIVEINRTDGLTILLVEQNAYQALKIANRGYVLATGRILMSGTGRELLANPEIRAAYLEGGH